MPFLKQRANAFKYAWQGIAYLFRNETHARIHLVAAVLVLITGFMLHISPLEWCCIIICIGGVFMAEAFNTAVEKVADKVTRRHDPLIGIAKDVAAGAVLLFVIASVAVGLIIFLPKLLLLIEA